MGRLAVENYVVVGVTLAVITASCQLLFLPFLFSEIDSIREEFDSELREALKSFENSYESLAGIRPISIRRQREAVKTMVTADQTSSGPADHRVNPPHADAAKTHHARLSGSTGSVAPPSSPSMFSPELRKLARESPAPTDEYEEEEAEYDETESISEVPRTTGGAQVILGTPSPTAAPPGTKTHSTNLHSGERPMPGPLPICPIEENRCPAGPPGPPDYVEFPEWLVPMATMGLGAPGIPGPMGKNGQPGAPGGYGSPGKQGAMGSRGAGGMTGQDGVVLLNTKGPKGPPGKPGTEGQPGEDGTNNNTPGPIGEPGNPGDVGTPGSAGLYGWRGDIGGIGERGQDSEECTCEMLMKKTIENAENSAYSALEAQAMTQGPLPPQILPDIRRTPQKASAIAAGGLPTLDELRHNYQKSPLTFAQEDSSVQKFAVAPSDVTVSEEPGAQESVPAGQFSVGNAEVSDSKTENVETEVGNSEVSSDTIVIDGGPMIPKTKLQMSQNPSQPNPELDQHFFPA
uniref:Col_cuticle_N domain-containing protein n=1 Tax=Caenorhabditis tropicalis TaxID=1561998 RepID=A0A1I7V2U7_9PELO